MIKLDDIMLNFDQYNNNFNSVKESVLNQLYTDKIITKSQYEIYNIKWNIIIIKKNWFPSWASKFFPKKTGENPTDYIFKYVRFEE